MPLSSRASDEATKLREELEDILKRVKKVEEIGGEGGAGGGWNSSKVRAYKKTKAPDRFSPGGVEGRSARWAQFAFGFGGYFGEQAKTGEAFLEWAAEQKEEVDDDMLAAYEAAAGLVEGAGVELSQFLYAELRLLCAAGEPGVT